MSSLLSGCLGKVPSGASWWFSVDDSGVNDVEICVFAQYDIMEVSETEKQLMNS